MFGTDQRTTTISVQGLGQTHTGHVRRNNEDSFVVEPELGLYAVCDGMGGHLGGEVAAETATSTISRVVRDRKDVLNRVEHDPAHAGDLVPVLQDALHEACRDIYNRSTGDDRLTGMGCTATAVVIAGSKAALAHVGDTRLYLIRDGEAHQLTSDHTMAADMVRQGALPPERLRGHPHSNILTRVLGPQAVVEVETLAFDVVPGDRLVLCSDGLTDYIPTSAWLAERVDGTSIEELPDELIEYANASGGRDNTTVVAIGVEGSAPTEELPVRSPHLALEVLGSSFLFSDLSLAQLSRVMDRCEARTYGSGAVIRNHGDVHDELLLIVSGTVRVTTPSGHSAVAGPGEHLGENLVLRPRPIRAKIIVEHQADILSLDRSSLLDLASRRPWLGVSLLSRLAERLSSDLDRLNIAHDQRARELAADLL